MTALTESPSGSAAAPAGRYDAIVIGSGASGLTCANTMVQAGMRVLVCEKNDWYGGLSKGYAEKGYYWDHGGHIFLAYRLGGQAREVFQRLRLDERVEMLPDRHDYTCNFPDESLHIPAELTEGADIFARRFPEERDAIQRVLLLMETLLLESYQFVPALRVWGPHGERRLVDPVMEQMTRPLLGRLAARGAKMAGAPGAALLKWQFKTFGELLDEYIKSPRLKAYFSMFSAGIGIGPAPMSAVVAALFLVNALNQMWMPKGGFSKIAQALAEMFQEKGGTLLTNAEVGRVLIEDGRAAGVETLDGRRFTADVVVSASDARRLYLKLIDPQHVPADLRARLPKMEVTPAWLQVYLGVDMDLEPYRHQLGRLNFLYPYDDLDRSMTALPNGNAEEAGFMLYVATLHQPELAPPGKHSLKLEVPTTYVARGIDWERDKEQLADVFVRRSEQLIPGLGRHVDHRFVRTPNDLERDTYNAEGAYCGWGWTPAMLSRNRPQQRSPIPGLYLCGHWTTPTAGVPWVMLSGYNTGAMVVGDVTKRRKAQAARR